MKKQKFILSFDLPREMGAMRARIHRRLVKIKAVKIHDSLWKSGRLNELVDIAMMIKHSGGSARILEERFIF